MKKAEIQAALPEVEVMMRFSADSYRVIEAMRIYSNLHGREEVMRQALELYYWVWRQAEKNFDVKVFKENGRRISSTPARELLVRRPR